MPCGVLKLVNSQFIYVLKLLFILKIYQDIMRSLKESLTVKIFLKVNVQKGIFDGKFQNKKKTNEMNVSDKPFL